MIAREQLLLLQDMNDNSFTDLIVFNNEVDMEAVKAEAKKLWDNEGGWTFFDLLRVLDKFGGYTIIPFTAVETIGY